MVNESSQSIQKSLNTAIKYLSYQPRTVYEMEKYMKKKGFNNNDIGKIIKILLENNYLNDIDFAKRFVESRAVNKPKSKFAFRYDLKKKGINASIIDDILEQYDDQELALKSVKPRLTLWQTFDDEKFKRKLMNYLQYRGFNYDICVHTLKYFTESRK